jgi:hypothetical protein
MVGVALFVVIGTLSYVGINGAVVSTSKLAVVLPLVFPSISLAFAVTV